MYIRSYFLHIQHPTHSRNYIRAIPNPRHRSRARHAHVKAAAAARMVATFLALTPLGLLAPTLAPQRRHGARALPARMAAAPSTLTTDCLVIGAGISGSTLAHNLHRAGVDLLLTEARDYVGGNVISHNEDGFVWEEGPNSFATQPSIVRIAYELGIADELVFADESLPPWVNHNGVLHPLPKGKGGKGPKGQLELVFGSNGVLKFGLAGQLLSWPGKIRAAIGALVGHLPPPEGKEETIREWVTRTLGEEVFLRCIDPFVSGVYAGDPETLSMRAALAKIARIENIAYSIEWNTFGAIFYGGLKRQVELTKERKAAPPDPAWPPFEYGNPGSFRRGLSTLPHAIAAELGQPHGEPPSPESKVRLQWRVTRLDRDEDGTFVATFDTPDGPQSVRGEARPAGSRPGRPPCAPLRPPAPLCAPLRPPALLARHWPWLLSSRPHASRVVEWGAGGGGGTRAREGVPPRPDSTPPPPCLQRGPSCRPPRRTRCPTSSRVRCPRRPPSLARCETRSPARASTTRPSPP